MKMLLDQGMPRSAAALLRQAGIDTVHTAGDGGLATVEDSVILEAGRTEGRIIVTRDADFHALMALSGAVQPSVIRVRIERLRSKELVELLLRVVQLCQPDRRWGIDFRPRKPGADTSTSAGFHAMSQMERKESIPCSQAIFWPNAQK